MSVVCLIQDLHAKIEEERVKKQHEESDAFILVVMTHGCGHGYIYSKDEQPINIREEIINKFDHRSCSGLRDKPKIFIIKACRASGMVHIHHR